MIHLKGFGMFPKKVQLTNPNVNSEKCLERSFASIMLLRASPKIRLRNLPRGNPQ